MTPLANLQVLDFSTLLPGPMASLILAEAGATVVKIDVCCSIVTDLRDAVADPQTVARKLFSGMLEAGAKVLPALPVPLAPVFRAKGDCRAAPRLDEHR
jgi:crotonobetainyl-CoA:carnitine CoA-transferase CaiB-like acyl-CoA transferase